MHRTIAVCAALLAAGCTNAVEKARQERIAEAEAAVKTQLRDPESAQFTEVRVLAAADAPEVIAISNVCGKVNAKNAYGGYAGPESFALIGGSAFLESALGEQAAMLESTCS